MCGPTTTMCLINEINGSRRRVGRKSRFLLVSVLAIAISVVLSYVVWQQDVAGVQRNLAKTDATNSQPRNESVAQTLEREVRILCWILTMPDNHKTKARHVMRTWGRRCTRLLFVTTADDDELDTITVPTEEGYFTGWAKLTTAFEFTYRNYLDEADWFIKADDDAYIFMENLRYMLYPYSSDMPLFFGYNFHLKQRRNESYFSGGCGYVMSREALRRLVEDAMPNSEICMPPNLVAVEDVEISVCLHAVGVRAGDSRDSALKQRFVPFEPYTLLNTGFWKGSGWFHGYSYYAIRACRDCLSEYAVGFHYVSAVDFYVYEFFNYHFELQVDERRNADELELPKKIKWDQLIIPQADNAKALIRSESSLN